MYVVTLSRFLYAFSIVHHMMFDQFCRSKAHSFGSGGAAFSLWDRGRARLTASTLLPDDRFAIVVEEDWKAKSSVYDCVVTECEVARQASSREVGREPIACEYSVAGLYRPSIFNTMKGPLSSKPAR